MAKQPEIGQFTVTLEELSHGKVLERLDEEIAIVVDAVADTTKKGHLNLKLIVAWENGMAMVTAEVSSKIPRHGLPASLFYFGEQGDGRLHREDPRQMKLKGLDSAPEAPLRSVAPLPMAPKLKD